MSPRPLGMLISGSPSKEAINEVSLSETGTKSWTSESDKPAEETEKWSEAFERKEEIDWLGLVDDFRTFRLERPAPEFCEFLAA